MKIKKNFYGKLKDGRDVHSFTITNDNGAYIELVDYNERKTTAPEYIKKLEKAYAGFNGAAVSVVSIDAGPPASDFTARIMAGDNRAGAEKLASDIATYLKSADIKRVDGSKVVINDARVENTDALVRADGKAYVGVTASFADDDTSALVTLTQTAVEKEFTTRSLRPHCK